MTALRKVKNEQGRGVMWEFLCDCGNIVEKIGSAISRHEGALHCGCDPGYFSKIKDETGNRYGKLLVLRYYGIDTKQRALWECACDCGNIIIHQGNFLIRQTSIMAKNQGNGITFIKTAPHSKKGII